MTETTALDGKSSLSIVNQGGGSLWLNINAQNPNWRSALCSLEFFSDGGSRQTWCGLLNLGRVLGEIPGPYPKNFTDAERCARLSESAWAVRNPDYEIAGKLRVIKLEGEFFAIEGSQSRQGRIQPAAKFFFGADSFERNPQLKFTLEELLREMQMDDSLAAAAVAAAGCVCA